MFAHFFMPQETIPCCEIRHPFKPKDSFHSWPSYLKPLFLPALYKFHMKNMLYPASLNEK